MDLIVRNARLADRPGAEPVDIGVEGGRIAAVGHGLGEAGESYDAGGRLACAGLIETHIHLDKSRLIDRLPAEAGPPHQPDEAGCRDQKGFDRRGHPKARGADPRRLHRQRHDPYAHPGRGRPGDRHARL